MAVPLFVLNDNIRAQRHFRRRLALEDIRDIDIVSRYRFDRQTIQFLIDLLSPYLEKATDRTQAIPTETQVLSSLRYLAKGDFYSEVGDIHGISRSSMSRILHHFTAAVCRRLNNISYPGHDGLINVKKGFYLRCQIPNVIGAIDCTHIPIIAPKDGEDAFVCRKGYHSLNVQAVVDADMRFMNVVTRWPGSMHVSAIFEHCGLKAYLTDNENGHLLGDSGYGLRTYLLTPYTNPITQQEINYNNKHSIGRVVVERAFGVLKSRFRCLHKSGGHLPFEPSRCASVIGTCMRLHNLAIDRKIALPDPPVRPHDLVADLVPLAPADNNGEVKRRWVAEHLPNN